ncbi:MAG: NUDIX domain-containing protein [Planctomycetes bacterium]|jgi:bis(5'-nucleosidyl)-tetraphosphatase|nr:NUDIX domain-containing protein [Planctomycetota bacterium]MCL4730452.1 NUDIX domain-containing protein [Planctomycetota bacterium]
MKTLSASGFILAHVDKTGPRWLLLRSARHGGWGFPKGHADPGEDELATARRETAEETGLRDLRVVDGFHVRNEYDVKARARGNYHKVVHYFLALAPGPEFTLSDEHSEAGWFTLDEALQKLAFPALRDALKAADAHLRKTRL